MKNGMFKKILSLTLVVLMILTAVLATGCATKSKGKKSKDKDKDTSKITIEEIKEKAEEEGYEVAFETYGEPDEVGTVAILEILDTNSEEYVYAQGSEYKDTDSANTAYNKVQMMKEQFGDLTENFVVQKRGKLVVFGSAEILDKVW